MKNPASIVVLASILFSTGSVADSITSKLDPAWTEVEKKTIQAVGQQFQRQLVDMAYAEIATDACPGIALNQAAITNGFDQMVANSGKTAPAERQTFERNMMAFFGIYTGLLLSESFIDKETFCKEVETAKQRKGGPTKYWTAK